MTSSNSHLLTGKKGEELAADYLKENGYTILAQNWRFQRGEIDIICQKNETLIFVEVKTRTNYKFGFPEESVSAQKQKLIMATAEAYLNNSQHQATIRYDIIAVRFLKNKEPEIYHIKDAFFGLDL